MVCIGERDDGRYPRVTPKDQIEKFDAMLAEAGTVPNYFGMTLWLAGVQRLGAATADGFEDQGIWTDRHNEPFNLKGETPIVQHLIDNPSAGLPGGDPGGEDPEDPEDPGEWPETPEPEEFPLVLDPPDVLSRYGLEIDPAPDVAPGQSYWQIVRVERIPAGQNNLGQNLWLDVLGADGIRDNRAVVMVKNTDRPPVGIKIDKPLGQYNDVPMWKQDTLAAWVDFASTGYVSEGISGVNTRHEDEEPGNQLYHFSFKVIWRLATRPFESNPGDPDPEEPPAGGPQGCSWMIPLLISLMRGQKNN